MKTFSSDWKGGLMTSRRRVSGWIVSWLFTAVIGTGAVLADPAGRLFLVDSQFTPAESSIYEVDPITAVLVLKGSLGQAYTPVFGMAAANASTFYLTGTDTSPSNLCLGFTSCLLLRVVLDPGSTTPSQIQVVGVVAVDGIVVPDITGLTFRQDGLLYGASQETDSLYRIDPATAQATFVGNLGIDLHGGDITFDDVDRLWAWSNIGSASGLYQIDPATGAASADELYPFIDFSGMAALMHGGVLYGANPTNDRLYTLDLNQGLNGGVSLTLGGQGFNHRRGDVDSPYCDDDAACGDGNLCTTDQCTPGGCVHLPLNLDDLNPCTQDSCTPEMGPLHALDPLCCLSAGACDDQQDCTVDTCEANRCVHRASQSCGSLWDPTVQRRERN
jgi:hypothetical protein